MIKQVAKKLNIAVGVSLVRAPVIAPMMSEIERKYYVACQAIEDENSLKSEFEIRASKDRE